MTLTKPTKSTVVKLFAEYGRRYPISPDNTIEIKLGAEAALFTDEDPNTAMIELEKYVENLVATIMAPKIKQEKTTVAKETSGLVIPPQPSPKQEPAPIIETSLKPEVSTNAETDKPMTWEDVGLEGKAILYGEDPLEKTHVILRVPVLDNFKWMIEEVNGKRWAKVLCGYDVLGEDGVWYKHGVKCWPEVMRKYLDLDIENAELYPQSVLAQKMSLPKDITVVDILYDRKERNAIKVIKFKKGEENV